MRTATASSENVRAAEDAMSAIRTRILARSAAVQVRPQVFVAAPRRVVAVIVVRVPVVNGVVQFAPPSEESCTHILGDPAVLSTLAAKLTSIPWITAVAGRLILYA